MVDIVITWVDGSDPRFEAKLKSFKGKAQPDRVPTHWRAKSGYIGRVERRERAARGGLDESSSVAAARFRNSEELRYALRSIEMHASFADRIFIVTNGQRPDWVDQAQPGLHFVNHRDIFPDPSVLPTFNSSAIETNLHRIPGLSDDFIYMNDDFFLGRPVFLEDFKSKEGVYKLFVEDATPLPKALADRSLIAHCWAFNHNLIIDRLGKIERARMFAHTPMMYSRRILQEVELVWRDEIEATRANRFRSPFDAHMRLLYTYFSSKPKLSLRSMGERKGLAELTSLTPQDYCCVRFGDDRSEYMKDLERILMIRPKFFCINDEFIARDVHENKIAQYVVGAFLQAYFPKPSRFEKFLPLAPSSGTSEEKSLTIEGVKVRLVEESEGDKPVVWHRSEGDADFRLHAETSELESIIAPPNEVRIIEPSGATYLELFVTIVTTAGHDNPLAGFKPERIMRVCVPDASDKVFKAQEWVNEYLARKHVVDSLSLCMAPLTRRIGNDPMVAFLKADTAIRAGDTGDEVIRLLEQSLTGGIEPFWVWHRLTLAHLSRKEHYPEAVDAIAQALRGRPEGIGIFQDLAEDLAACGMFGEALPAADGILAFNPEDSRATYVSSLARYHFNAQDPRVGNLLGQSAPSEHVVLWAKVMRRQKESARVVLPVLEDAIANGRKTFEILLAAAMAHFDAGNRQLALMNVAEAMGTGVSGAGAILAARGAEIEGYPIISRWLLDAVRVRMPWEKAAIAPLARLLVADGLVGDEILMELDALINGGDHLADAFVAKAALLIGRGRDAEAIAAVESAGEDANSDAVLKIAREAQARGRIETALSLTRALCNFQPWNVMARQYQVEIMRGHFPVRVVLEAIEVSRECGSAESWVLAAQARTFAEAGDTIGLRSLVGPDLETDGLQKLDALVVEFAGERTDAALALASALARVQPDSVNARMRWVTLAIDHNAVDPEVRSALGSLQSSDPTSPANFQHFRLALADGDGQVAAMALRLVDTAWMDDEPYLLELERYKGELVYEIVMRERSVQASEQGPPEERS